MTPEEHYIAHQLLVKMYPGNIKLLWAASNMTGKTSKMLRNNKLYGWLRRKLAETFKGRIFSNEARIKMSKNHAGTGMKGHKHSEETKAKMSSASKGKTKTEEHRKALSIAKKGKKRDPHSEETKEKIRHSNKLVALNRDYSYRKKPDYKQFQSQCMKEIWIKRNNGVLPMPMRNKTIERI